MIMKTKVIWVAMLTAVVVALLVLWLFLRPQAAQNDFSRLSWTHAFEKLHQEMSIQYAFTEWKSIDWEELYGRYHPMIKKAQSEDDFDSYYLALHAFLNELHDGHVRADNLEKVDNKYIGGGFGLDVAELVDGRVIITWVDEESEAWTAGLRPRAELTGWNGKPIGKAVGEVSTILAGPSATDESRRLKKLQYLVRAPVGSQAEITWRADDSVKTSILTLTAYDDGGLSLKKCYPDSILSDKLRNMYLGKEDDSPTPESVVETKILEGNICYVRLWAELDTDLQGTGTAASTVELLRKAVSQANEQGCIGMILDIRNNMGGLDSMSAEILGSFYSGRSFYEYQSTYEPATKEYVLGPVNNRTGEAGLFIEPAQEQFTGPVIALINHKCISSGEGVALGIKNLPNGETLGFRGTSGSFGLAGSEAEMPGGITVNWPSGQSLDIQKGIQLDSRNGSGGVSPSIRIPMTEDNALRAVGGEDVELEEAVRILSEGAKNHTLGIHEEP
jgi:carboxyl-terminal processing protease